MRPLIIDSFAGGGGASEGIRAAIGRDPDFALNQFSISLAIIKFSLAINPRLACDHGQMNTAFFSGKGFIIRLSQFGCSITQPIDFVYLGPQPLYRSRKRRGLIFLARIVKSGRNNRRKVSNFVNDADQLSSIVKGVCVDICIYYRFFDASDCSCKSVFRLLKLSGFSVVHPPRRMRGNKIAGISVHYLDMRHDAIESLPRFGEFNRSSFKAFKFIPIILFSKLFQLSKSRHKCAGRRPKSDDRSNQCLISIKPEIEAVDRTIFVPLSQNIEHKFRVAEPILRCAPTEANQKCEKDEQEGGEAPVHALISQASRVRAQQFCAADTPLFNVSAE